MRIQHNIAALSSYRNLTNNNSAVSKNLEKLSSGYRINRAGDDAAGLAISEKMRAQITGLKTAQKNANDGISLIQTAEGALTEVHSMLNRMVELASQSANGTYQDEDRANLQAEVKALQDEINRISEGTNFNGINLLDGSLGGKVSAVGMTDMAGNLTIKADGQLGKAPQAAIYSFDLSQVSIQSTKAGGTIKTFTVGGQDLFKTGADKTVSSSSPVSGVNLAGKIKTEIEIDKVKYDVKVTGTKVTLTAQKPADAPSTTKLNVVLEATNATVNNGEQIAVTVEQEGIGPANQRMYGQAEFALDTTIVKDGGALKIGDTTYTFAVGKNSSFKGGSNVIDLTDMTATSSNLVGIAAGRLTAAAKNNKNFYVGTDYDKATGKTMIRVTEKEGGVDYEVNNLAGDDGKGANGSVGTVNANSTHWRNLIQKGVASISGSNLTLQIGDTSDDFNQLKVAVGDMSASALGISGIDISTQAGATDAINKVKAAINSVSSTRGDLGALQNRLEHTINNLSVTTENMTAAESRIRDVDMAEEMMAYTKNNILVQASQAMLAQANQIPQGVLQLLQ
ncbi:MAG: flagellin [Dorea sp.]|nr:flagellin [Dorea sp.]